MHIFLMENNRRPLCIIKVTGSRAQRPGAGGGCGAAGASFHCWWGNRTAPRPGGLHDCLETDVLIATHGGRHMPWYSPQELQLYCPRIGSNQDVL